jgi:hypothetical protein
MEPSYSPPARGAGLSSAWLDRHGQPWRTLKRSPSARGGAPSSGGVRIANTPQQDLAYARWAKCNSPSGTLERVDLDGRITFRVPSTASDRQEIVQCLAEAGQHRAARSRAPSASAL